MRIRSKLLALLAGGFWMVTAVFGKAVTEEEFVQSGVIPLPARPPSDVKGLIAVLEPYSHLNSRLADAQIAGWLRLLKVEQLQALQAAMPGGWHVPPPDIPMDYCGLREVLSEVIAAHPDLPVASDHPLTAIEAGRRAGKDRKTGMETAKTIRDPKIRGQFILGLLQSADNARTYAESMEIRSALLSLWPESERLGFDTYEEEKRAMLWPVESIVAWVMSLAEDERFGKLDFIGDRGAHYFGDLDEATKFLAHFGRHGPGQFPGVAEAMGPVLAARDPEGFLAWWENLDANARSYAIEDAIVPLMRHDASLIRRVLPRLEVKSLGDFSDVTKEWYKHDPAAALEYCSKLKDFAESADWWIRSERPLKPIEPSVAVDLLNRYPATRDASDPILRFDPHRHRPDAYAREILRILDPKTREFELFGFGSDWGFQDGPAALAWTQNIPQAAERKKWLQGLAWGWIEKSPDDFAKALDGMKDLAPEERKRLETQVADRRASLARPQAPMEPSRFAGRSSKKALPLPDGGPTDAEALAKIRQSLAQLARPAEPPAANIPLCAEVLGLGEKTVVALLRELEAHPPTDARENVARVVLLERWALSAPEAAARWMVKRGSGMTRQPLPLALSKIAQVDAELARTLADQIPVGQLHYSAKHSILYALATRDHREACEFGERHIYPYPFDMISRDWRRADRSAAEAWLKARWLDRHY